MNDDYDTITINLYSVPLDSSEYFYLKYTTFRFGGILIILCHLINFSSSEADNFFLDFM